MQRAWRGETVTDGDEPVTLSPLPVQKPHPPIWVAAFGPKALAQVGRLGLPYLASPMEPLAVLRRNYELHREACGPARSAELPVPVMRTTFVTRDSGAEKRVRDELERQVAGLRKARPLRLGDAPLDDFALLGPPERVAERIATYREHTGMTHLIARTHMPGASDRETQASLELLAELAQGDRE
jgi:alkanesulfonate monooxygenase SsuD/methylene tetrahydromethanopterin reductase-like flavin-dependent oxidoreductase (luciferase family)